MKIPKKLKIGENEYTISESHFLFETVKNISGQINWLKETIKIKKGLKERMQEDTFFHEIAHGILKELEYNHPAMVKYRNNEEFVQEMGLLIRKIFLQLQKEQLHNSV